VTISQFSLSQLFLNLELEFVAGASEFADQFPQLPSNLRQLLGPENDQG
jgi:hypothetical protein